MNSKSEIVGTRIGRTKVTLNEETLEMLAGEISKLEPQERKLLSELEEGGEDFVDRELWTKIIVGGKRKMKKSTSQEGESAEVEVRAEVGNVRICQNIESKLFE